MMARSCVVAEPRFPSKFLDNLSLKFTCWHLRFFGMFSRRNFKCAVCVKHSTNMRELHLQYVLDKD